ncbi:MAG TPA: HAD-IIB family hydrolase [Candidatus Solibacter sp.]|nr:HAD-IIB family hydrolase [Candidatus Solibacter sp.]
MRYAALATDYDGTIAHDGRVPDDTLRALERFRKSGRKTILATGRHLPDLLTVFQHMELFDLAVMENGAILYTPSTREMVALAPPPNPAFIDELHRRGVHPEVGEVIVATWTPNETTVLEVIRDLGLDLQVIFNKGAVMVLPSGINKRSGLKVALNRLGISEHNTIGVGDAENDHAFLKFCEVSVAVANAHPAIKQIATFTTQSDHGEGVEELIEMVFAGTLPNRMSIPVGRDAHAEACIPAYAESLLVAGASGSGKSTFVAGLIEVLAERRYQFCLIDPEGDYESLPGTITAGDEKHPPSVDEVMQMLQKPSPQVVVNLIGVAVAARPAFLAELLPRLQELRLRLGRPHWIIVDEAHHMLQRDWTPAAAGVPGELRNMILITVHPGHVSRAALEGVTAVFVVGPHPVQVLRECAAAIGAQGPNVEPTTLDPDEVLAWFRRTGQLRKLMIHYSHADRKRHKRNYAHGEISEERSFYFRGPEHKLKLRAQNLSMFIQLAEGLDDETWLYHLRRGDYSRWFREGIKDESLAAEAEACERDSMSARESREKIKNAIEQRYTAPA